MKLNAAAILREGARIQREEDEEEKKLASLEAGQGDSYEFTKWQEEMKQRDLAEQLVEVERKHLVRIIQCFGVCSCISVHWKNAPTLTYVSSSNINPPQQEGQLSYEEAIIAKQTHSKEMREKVSQIKEQLAEMMNVYFSRREEEQKEMRQLVEDTMSGHQNTKEAKSKLQAMKQKIGE